MSLIKCPDCGGMLSDSASACPRCGRVSNVPHVMVKNLDISLDNFIWLVVKGVIALLPAGVVLFFLGLGVYLILQAIFHR